MKRMESTMKEAHLLENKAKKILVADDQPHVLRVLRLVLEKAGYQVDAAANGRIALEWIRQNQPDALITDIFMPEMTGRELCENLQREWPERSFPILVMTSRTERSEKDWTRNIANLEVVEKPVSPRQLVSRMGHLLDTLAH